MGSDDDWHYYKDTDNASQETQETIGSATVRPNEREATDSVNADIIGDADAGHDVIADALRRAKAAAQQPIPPARERLEALRKRVALKEAQALAARGARPLHQQAGEGNSQVDGAGEAPTGSGGPNASDLALVLAERRFGLDWRAKVHRSHRPALAGGKTLFCRRCGSYSGGAEDATARLRGLAIPCRPLQKREAMARTAVAKLARGRHPLSGKQLGDGAVQTLPPDWAGQE